MKLGNVFIFGLVRDAKFTLSLSLDARVMVVKTEG